MRYIAYEMAVDELRRKRKARLAVQSNHSVSDSSIVRNIHLIFSRAVRRFPSDVALWMQYFNYCANADRTTSLTKIFTRALELHPHATALWILAAQHEYSVNANMLAARVLLQRAIRLNETSRQVWLEYCRLELVYMHKLAARMLLAGMDIDAARVGPVAAPLHHVVDDEDEAAAQRKAKRIQKSKQRGRRRRNTGLNESGSGSAHGDESAASNSAEIVDFSRHAANASGGPDGGGSDAGDDDAGGAGGDELQSAERLAAVLRGAIPYEVMCAAFAAFPTDLDLRKRFVTLLAPFDLTEGLIDALYASLPADFQASAPVAIAAMNARRAWDCACARAAAPAATESDEANTHTRLVYALDASDRKFAQACAAWPADDTAGLAAFAEAHLILLDEAVANFARRGYGEALATLEHLLGIGAEAARQPACSERTFALLQTALARVDAQRASALGVDRLTIAEAAVQRHPASASLWTARLQALRQAQPPAGLAMLEAMFAQALAACGGAADPDALAALWCERLAWQLDEADAHGDEAAALAAFAAAGAHAQAQVAERFFTWAAAHRIAATRVRATYGIWLRGLLPPVGLFRACLAYEAASGAQGSVDAQRTLLRDACDRFGASQVDLWLQAVRLELSRGVEGVMHVGRLHDAALRALASDELREEFVTEYQALRERAAPAIKT